MDLFQTKIVDDANLRNPVGLSYDDGVYFAAPEQLISRLPADIPEHFTQLIHVHHIRIGCENIRKIRSVFFIVFTSLSAKGVGAFMTPSAISHS